MTISAICNREVITVRSDATVLHAATLMRQYHVGDVVVIEDRKGKSVPVGIVTDRDIVIELVATELDCKVITTGDIMANNLAVIKEGAGIFDAIQLMTAKGVRRLPVVDDGGGLLGIITLDDLLLILSKELGSLSKLVSREQKNEVSKRP
ncbi:CBS domain-containing protein [Methylotenera sp.]|uniref:CBS domain-containing protein n=2 Tax=Methylotenera sp. TaxID=2051956 RepID=UPI00271D71BC|nr:CBS domain-containing protein [Methylotenera sp.]MDO9206321.1 CBS domain-containing protein [Methylotenera sp.]MDP1522787.1 CBS domain-containing protein [Methylotenera sp.]MDP2071972.1 CBS domain-containing protein [Methylotenera sp.]MDP3007019.1 CBS domain-containing protein [Methylotenera sp.]MDP3007044.1 CBS domain-containing protein [Methylotenera sp.]